MGYPEHNKKRIKKEKLENTNNNDFNYEEDLLIDKNNLDDIFIKQPILAMKYQEQLAIKQTEKNDLNLELEILEATIDREIRDTFTKKPTETEIKNMILMDERRKKKVKKYHKVIEECNILKGAVNSFEHRKKALEKLTDLYIAEYFSRVNPKSKEKIIRNKLRKNL